MNTITISEAATIRVEVEVTILSVVPFLTPSRAIMACAFMESERFGGYDECFLDEAQERLVCSICTKVMRDPHLMACCGKEFCISCLQSWFNQQNTEECPHCRATKRDYNVLHILDKGVKSEIESQFILCTNYKEDCEWVGELRNQASHLDKCDYSQVDCPRGCKTSSGTLTRLLRKDLAKHLNNYCELREKRCTHCGHITTVKSYPTHERVCDYIEIDCPKRCKTNGILTTILRKDMNMHLRRHCQLREKQCRHCGHVGTAKSYPSHERICEVLHPPKHKKSCIIS